jgi:ATP-dependent DNA helicase RecQ
MQLMLKNYFGYDSLRPSQEPVIESVMSGRDTVTIMPTGGGKSMCYQLPAVVNEGMVLVISPLIALMHDQVESLKKNGVAAGLLNSSIPKSEQMKYIKAAEEGALQLLYVSPERLLGSQAEFIKWVKTLNLSLIAIDEAHCVSQWGHDFRPEYSRLGVLKTHFPNTPMIALTATADELTREDIVQQLKLDNPNIFISSFDRPNIRYTVEPKAQGNNATQQLVTFVKSFDNESGIVYCLSRKTTEEVAAKLMQAGISAAPFHAGLTDERKSMVYNAFMQDNIQVVVATIAFGMGVDKPDVRFVAHWNMPKSIENYYQETGRAGRDGLPSEALLLYTPGDAATYRRFIDQAKPAGNPEKYKVFQKLQHDKLERLIDFCSTGHCRRRILLQYFHEDLAEDCGNCDACLSPKDKFDGTELAQKIVSTIARTGQKFGIGYIADILKGVVNDRTQKYEHTTLSVFGLCEDMNRDELMFHINELMSLGYIAVNYDGHIKTLGLNEKSMSVAMGNERLYLTPYEEVIKKPKKSRSIKKATENLSEEDQEYFEVLRQKRSEIAKSEDVPAFVVFGNTTLLDIVDKRPKTKEEFAQISGVGEFKLEKYYDQFEGVLQ